MAFDFSATSTQVVAAVMAALACTGIGALVTKLGPRFVRALRRYLMDRQQILNANDLLFAENTALRAELTQARIGLADAVRSSDLTHRLIGDLSSRLGTVEANDSARGAEMTALRSQIENLKTRNDALADFAELVLAYATSLERLAIEHGIDTGGLRMPPVPDIIADRLGIPEGMR